MPVVSLLVPIYNAEEYLEECLESAKAQTLEDIEIICINDGSRDKSKKIIKKFMDSDARFKLIDKENSGYGASMNRGLEAATGKYIGILESDDIMDKNALSRLVSLADACNADVAKGDFYRYWSKPKERKEEALNIPYGLVGKMVNIAENPRIMYKQPSIWSAIYRRGMIKKNNIRFLETPGASYQDTSFDFKVWVCTRRAVFTKFPVVQYRQDNESSSINSPEKVYCVCDEYAEMRRFLEEHPEKLEKFSGVLERMKYNTYLWNYNRLEGDLKLEFLEHMSEELARDQKEGLIERELFEDEIWADLQVLIKSPEEFNAIQQQFSGDSRGDNIKHYMKVGGPALVGKLFARKFKKSKDQKDDDNTGSAFAR